MLILVTGGAGFIGSHLVRSILTDVHPGLAGARVRVLDLMTYTGREENLAPVAGSERFELHRGDIRDPVTVAEAMHGVDLVVHCAAESHVDRSITDATDFVSTNVTGTQTLLAAAVEQRVAKFVHVSTDEVYGSVPNGSSVEDDPLQPNSPYAASKAASDLLVRACHRTFGLDVSITRCSNNYGPHQYPEKLIPLFVTRLLRGETVPLYGDGNNTRDWLHVVDHCRALVAVALRGRAGRIYNIGGGTELTNRELTAMLLSATGRDWDAVQLVTDRPGHDLRYSVDWTRAHKELGFHPVVAFDEGIAATVDWYRHREVTRPPTEVAL
ncbi:dTDP-glucose 4,6-dehydratase [Salinifilum ghardaiensis]